MCNIERAACLNRLADIRLTVFFDCEGNETWIDLLVSEESPSHSATNDVLVATSSDTKSIRSNPLIRTKPVFAALFQNARLGR
jgi:hypothetical protein